MRTPDGPVTIHLERQADEVVARLRSAPVELHRLAGLGHLAHEEAPSQVGALLEAALIPV